MRTFYIALFILSIPGVIVIYITCWPYFTVSKGDVTIFGYLAPFLMLLPMFLLQLISHEEHRKKYFHTCGGDVYWEFNSLTWR